jgi:hypothetical protein
MRRFSLPILGAVLLLLPSFLFGRDAREQTRIDFLIHEVETSTGFKFIRNGTEYDGAAAAAHLRMKLAYLGDKVKTAEQFVKYCASESSMTHQKYKVREADGTTMEAANYFNAELRRFDEKH